MQSARPAFSFRRAYASVAHAAAHRHAVTVMPARGHDRAATLVIVVAAPVVVVMVAGPDIDAARARADDDALGARGADRAERGGRQHGGSDSDPFHVLPPDLHDGSRRQLRTSARRSAVDLKERARRTRTIASPMRRNLGDPRP